MRNATGFVYGMLPDSYMVSIPECICEKGITYMALLRKKGGGRQTLNQQGLMEIHSQDEASLFHNNTMNEREA